MADGLVPLTADFPCIDGSLWADNGPVAAAHRTLSLPYSYREPQGKMGNLITKALIRPRGQPRIFMIAASTGVGKTLAYLIPGMLAIARDGGRMLVSTHTLALMEQIASQDGPVAIETVRQQTGKTLVIAQRRGRRNFSSPTRCRALAASLQADGADASIWEPYLRLADIAENANRQAAIILDQSEDVLPGGAATVMVSALFDSFETDTGFEVSRDDCALLATSPDEEQAAYKLGVLLVSNADVILLPHATTAIWLAGRTVPGGKANAEPFRFLVIDEADQWAAAAENVSMTSVSLDAIEQSLRSLMHVSRTSSIRDIGLSAAEAIAAISDLRAMAPEKADTRVRIDAGDGAFTKLRAINTRLAEVLTCAAQAREVTASVAGHVEGYTDEIDRVFNSIRGNSEFWAVEWQTSRVHGKPSIVVRGKAPGRILRRVWKTADGKSPLAETILLTSATLATPGFERPWSDVEIKTGIAASKEEIKDGRGAAIEALVDRDLNAVIEPRNFGSLKVRFADPRAPIPKPDDNGKLSADAIDYIAAVIAVARANKGRTLVLVPSYQDVAQLAPALDGSVLLHKRGTSKKTMERRYRETEGACLVTPAAWVGTNLPGLVNQLVIPRLPFPPGKPGDGETRFASSLADMLCKLAQGIGRGIRTHTDSCILYFADPRMPPPDDLIERTLEYPFPTPLARHPSANPLYLKALPARFVERFSADEAAADFSFLLPDETRAATRVPRAQSKKKGC
ncbi:MAG: helicase C-terminal domain-containing protein [Rhodospirillaceae bacterium]